MYVMYVLRMREDTYVDDILHLDAPCIPSGGRPAKSGPSRPVLRALAQHMVEEMGGHPQSITNLIIKILV